MKLFAFTVVLGLIPLAAGAGQKPATQPAQAAQTAQVMPGAVERQADAYALRAIPSKSAFVSSMEKLAGLNLAERQPHPWIEFLFHSHPSIDKRIAFAQKFDL